MGTSLLGVIIAIRIAGSINAHGQKTEPPALRHSRCGACAPPVANLFEVARIVVANWFARLRVAIALPFAADRAVRAPRSGWARALSDVSFVTTKTMR